MKIRILLLALATMAAAPTQADFSDWFSSSDENKTELPILSPSGCGNDGLTLMVNGSTALVVETLGGKSKVAISTAETIGDAGSLVLTIEGEGGELMLPSSSAMEQCDFLPGLLPVIFVEAIAFFRQLHPQCYAGNAADALCIASAFEAIDISGDGAFSKAELSRAVRAAGFFIGHNMLSKKAPQSGFVDLVDMYAVQLVSSALGPVIGGNLIESYDYNGDNLLSPKELMQDRIPKDGAEGLIVGIASDMPHQMIPALLKPLTGILDILK